MPNFNSTGDGMMTHAIVPLPDAPVHAAHPFKHKANHQKLLQYLQSRLQLGKRVRDNKLPRMVRVDKSVAGWMKLSDEDKKRERSNDRDGTPQAVSINLPLSFVHLDDMMTYFAQTFAPNRGMFYHTGKPGETQQASQIVVLMNNHAIYSGYYREVLFGLYSVLKYNAFGYQVFWSKENGPKITKDSEGKDRVDSELKWQGNKMEALDFYNFLHDPMVPLTKLHCDGEFAATARLRGYYWLQNKASQGVYFNCKEAFDSFSGFANCAYYRSPPVEAKMDASTADGSDTNWVSVLAEVPDYAAESGFEITEISIKLNPTEFGLLPGSKKELEGRNRYECWRFTLLNDSWIIDATYQNNIHGYLPYLCGHLNDDAMGPAAKAPSEILKPLQDFSSFLLNTHVFSTRSSIWGLTVYDPMIVNLKAIPKGEVNATIPVEPAGYGKDINTAIWKHNSALETKQTMADLGAMMDIINQFFPTQSLPSQIASIDRAVDSQVAAVQQGANRRQQKAARLLDDSVFRNVRFIMYYNIIQYQPDDQEVTDYYTGAPVKIDLASLRNTDLPFIIGQGLKSLDRMAAANMIQQIIFAMIQAPAVAQGIDLLGLIDYWTSMLDVDIDMTKFRLAPQQAPGAAAPEGGVDPATGAPIQPATAPEAVTTPIYKG